MAIYNGRILVRKGNEADFDASKLQAGEWAVSLDKGIVRICLQAGTCIRMATYEAFEEDMAQIEAILLECQTIQEAVTKINTEIDGKVDAVVEYVAQAKTYRDEAEAFRNEAEAFKNEAFATTPEGYEELVENVAENTHKVDTIIEKAVLGITETASGEEIHLTDSAEGKAIEFTLYGKATQNTTSGNNLLENTATSQTVNGVTFTINSDGSVTASGTATANAWLEIFKTTLAIGSYILNGCPSGGSSTTYRLQLRNSSDTEDILAKEYGSGAEFSIEDSSIEYSTFIGVMSGVTINTTFYPMIRLASITDDTYEPYTGGIASPNPDYPQEIEVSGASYNLLENTATSQTVDGATYTVNEDKSITVNGTSTSYGNVFLKEITLPAGKYTVTCDFSGEVNAVNNTYVAVRKYADDGTSTVVINYGYTSLILKEETTLYVVLAVVKNSSFNNVTAYPMIRKATVTNDRYMPYGVGSVEVRSQGKNFYDLSKTEILKPLTKIEINDNSLRVYNEDAVTYASTKVPIDFSKLKAGKTYTLSADADYKSGKGRLAIRRTNDNVILKATSYITSSGKYSSTFEMPSDDCYVSIFATLETADIGDITYSNIQLEEGSSVTEYEPYKETLSTISTENGLAGIPVSSGGNHTDQNGQQWICDEVVKYADGSGAFIQRIERGIIDENKIGNAGVSENGEWISTAVSCLNNNDIESVMSDKAIAISFNERADNKEIARVYSQSGKVTINMPINSNFFTDTDTAKQWIQSNVITCVYALAEPITTPLTAEELAEIATYYPVTNISNDFDCDMYLKYDCDSKNYIDKKFEALAVAMVNNI